MNIPAKVMYQGQPRDVVGYVGSKYRFKDGTTAPMRQCSEYVEPAEGEVMFIDTAKMVVPEPIPFINESGTEITLEAKPKARKGGRPRKVKEAE